MEDKNVPQKSNLLSFSLIFFISIFHLFSNVSVCTQKVLKSESLIFMKKSIVLFYFLDASWGHLIAFVLVDCYPCSVFFVCSAS